METFKASVQYGDLSGTAAADRSDTNFVNSWLKDQGLIGNHEHVIGIRMWAGENHGAHKDPVSVHFLVTELSGHPDIPTKLKFDEEPVQVREVQVDMEIAEFLGYFKRFEVTLSSSGLLEGKNYITK